jgi:tripartite-type tricarboxylate transporter receptor subunit TctC
MRITFLAAAALACAVSAGAAEPWPSRTLTIVVPFTPGTTADTIARLFSPQLAEHLQVPVVVDNKPGASGAIGTEAVAKSPPDGYTVLFTATSHGTVPALKRDVPYDPVKSFAPVALAATSALALVVNPRMPATFAEFVALAKKEPGRLYYSTPGNGSPQHLTMELAKLEAGIDLVHVPYKGSAGATRDLAGGHVQATIASLQTVAQLVKTGKLRMLAVLSEERSPAFPDVPTMKELGHPGLVVDTWYGVFAPAGTPPEIVARLNSEMNALLRLPETAQAFGKLGLVPVVDKPERLGALVDSELARWTRVVASAHIRGD